MIYWDTITNQQIVRYDQVGRPGATVHLGCAKHTYTETDFPEEPRLGWMCIECCQDFNPIPLEQKPDFNPHFL